MIKKGFRIFQLRQEQPGISNRSVGRALDLPASTVDYQVNLQARRNQYPESQFWESEEGQYFLKILVLGVLYFFSIKSGVGAGRVKEFFKALRLYTHIGISESSILRKIKEVELLILKYKELREKDLLDSAAYKEGLNLILGLDETWLDNMLLVCQELTSGYLFCEQVSEKRDAPSWWKVLSSNMGAFWAQSQVRLLVSDRAKALIKLGKPGYLNAFSMPDLFHFMQDIARSVGSKLRLKLTNIGKQLSKARLTEQEKEALQEKYEQLEEWLSLYTTYRQGMNQLVHPFDEQGKLLSLSAIEIGLNRLYTKIRAVAQEAGITISIAQCSKVINQIPDIAKGVFTWQTWLQEELKSLLLAPITAKWLLEIVLPYAYWQLHLAKISTRKRDKLLRQDCKNRATQSQQRLEQFNTDDLPITQQQKELYVNWAFQMAATFHRSSSQVEGRNGYLAFMHNAHRGIPEQRQQALTVVHNFDIRRADDKTPAERLFKMDFPDLFDFIVQNVTDFASPRKGAKARA